MGGLVATLPLLTSCTASPREDGHQVALRATGSPGTVWVSWAAFGDRSSGPESLRTGLPWTRTISLPRGAAGDLTTISLSVVDRAGRAPLACRITVDGRVVSAQRGTGGASCDADLREP